MNFRTKFRIPTRDDPRAVRDGFTGIYKDLRALENALSNLSGGTTSHAVSIVSGGGGGGGGSAVNSVMVTFTASGAGDTFVTFLDLGTSSYKVMGFFRYTDNSINFILDDQITGKVGTGFHFTADGAGTGQCLIVLS